MVEQSMLGRLFNYGTIKITTGEVVNSYQFIASPIRFRTKLNETLDQLDASKPTEENLKGDVLDVKNPHIFLRYLT